jgi:hypothetical protein
MSNETYLHVTYVGFGLLSLGLAAAVYAVLRTPFGHLADSATRGMRNQFFKRIFPVFLTLVACAGFFGVSYNYTACGNLTYEQVVKDRAHLVKTNRRQIGETADWLAAGVLLWSGLAVICLISVRKPNAGAAAAQRR